MPAKLKNKDIHRRMAVIRTQNVQRHENHVARNLLRDNIVRKQKQDTFRMELDRLRGASVQGHLGPTALKRIADLTQKTKAK